MMKAKGEKIQRKEKAEASNSNERDVQKNMNEEDKVGKVNMLCTSVIGILSLVIAILTLIWSFYPLLRPWNFDYEERAKQGDQKARYRLADINYESANISDSVYWYSILRDDQGPYQAYAYNNLACIYVNRDDLEDIADQKDKALEYFMKSYELGCPIALENTWKWLTILGGHVHLGDELFFDGLKWALETYIDQNGGELISWEQVINESSFEEFGNIYINEKKGVMDVDSIPEWRLMEKRETFIPTEYELEQIRKNGNEQRAVATVTDNELRIAILNGEKWAWDPVTLDYVPGVSEVDFYRFERVNEFSDVKLTYIDYQDAIELVKKDRRK